jgi:hypothetical protein
VAKTEIVAKTILNTSDAPRQLSVVALAGRRVDAPGARQVRFPPRNAPVVENGIRKCFQKGVRVLVCSAACGSDLLALGVANELGLRRRIVLPFARALFRETSVADRPGDWGERYDRALNEVERQRDLVILGYEQSDPAAFARTNAAIVDEALRIARQEGKLAQALVVWDGKSRGSADLTAQFLDEARGKGMPILEIRTLTSRPRARGVVARGRLEW